MKESAVAAEIQRTMHDVEYLVVGAGPAGLAVSAYLSEHGREYLVVEQGMPVEDRRHDVPQHLGQGVGGAGLYSDGKFSFFPSASALWKLADNATLRNSYQHVTELLAAIGVTAPTFPDVSPNASIFPRDAEKRYPSVYASLSSRTKLIDTLTATVAPHLETGRPLLAIRAHEAYLHAHIWHLGRVETIRVDAII